MTYRELLKELQGLTREQLDMDVSVLTNQDEYMPVEAVELAGEQCDVLDLGHPIIVI